MDRCQNSLDQAPLKTVEIQDCKHSGNWVPKEEFLSLRKILMMIRNGDSSESESESEERPSNQRPQTRHIPDGKPSHTWATRADLLSLKQILWEMKKLLSSDTESDSEEDEKPQPEDIPGGKPSDILATREEFLALKKILLERR